MAGRPKFPPAGKSATAPPERAGRADRWWTAPAAAAVVAAVLALPHLGHPPWHDELYTAFHFIKSPATALLDYRLPNNHILFSLAWWAWTEVVPEAVPLRWLPYGCFVAAAFVLAAAGRRWCGCAAGGWLAGLVFATMHPALAFGAELRGYAPSMLYAALGLYSLARWRGDGRRRWLVLHGAAGFLAVGTVPVNLAAFAPWAAWAFWAWRRRWRPFAFRAGKAAKGGPGAGAVASLAFAPLTGLLPLLPVAGQLAAGVSAGSSMAKASFLWHYPYAAVFDFLWLPLAAWVLVARTARENNAAPSPLPALVRSPDPAGNGNGDDDDSGGGDDPDAARDAGIFLLCTLFGPVVCALACPRTPNDYTMVATLPGVALGLGTFTAAAWRRLRMPAATGTGGRRFAWAAPTAPLLLIAAGIAREAYIADRYYAPGAPPPAPCPWLVDAEGRDIAAYNLYRQGYQNDRAPLEAADAFAGIARETAAAGTVGGCFGFMIGGDQFTARSTWLLRHGDLESAKLGMLLPAVQAFDKPEAAGRARNWWRGAARRLAVVFGDDASPNEVLAGPLDLDRAGSWTRLRAGPGFVIWEWRPGK